METTLLLDLFVKVDIPIIISSLLIISTNILTYYIAKKQIISTGITQFRQKWIDDLRDCISVFIAKAEMISMLDYGDDEQYYNHFKELSQMQNKMELMLSPFEDDHNKVIGIADKIRDIIHKEDIDDAELNEQLNEKIDELLYACKIVLKKEWTIVKKGK